MKIAARYPRMTGTHYKVTDRAAPHRSQVVYADSLQGACNVARNLMAYADPIATRYATR